MIRNIHPAEELFEIRAEIRALKAREAELRAYFLTGARVADRRGPRHEIAVTDQRRRVFARNRLPAAILEDPRYWRQKLSRVVKLLPRAPVPACPTPAPILQLSGTPDDPLFEPFA